MVVVDVEVVVVFWSPNVFQIEGPAELNQGGLGLDVDEAGVAVIETIVIKDKTKKSINERNGRRNQFVQYYTLHALIVSFEILECSGTRILEHTGASQNAAISLLIASIRNKREERNIT